MAGVLELSSRTPGIISQTIIVDALVGERNIAFLKEFLPTDPLCPLANTLILFGIFGVGLENLLNCGNSLRPAWSSVRQERNNQLGELRH